MFKKGKSIKSIFEHPWNNPFIEFTFEVTNPIKLTEVKDLQLANI